MSRLSAAVRDIRTEDPINIFNDVDKPQVRIGASKYQMLSLEGTKDSDYVRVSSLDIDSESQLVPNTLRNHIVELTNEAIGRGLFNNCNPEYEFIDVLYNITEVERGVLYLVTFVAAVCPF